MPFTFAHPAAVLPVHRYWPRAFVLSALVIGSMAPDFAYLLPPFATRHVSHSLAGSLLFCVPAGLIVYTVFHLLLKAPLAALLPDSLARPASALLQRTPALPERPLLVVLGSLWLGAASHILWDAFTHAPSPVTTAFPALQIIAFHLGGYPVAVHRILQHASTLAGAVALALALRRTASRFAANRAELPPPAWSSRQRVLFIAALLLLPALFALGWNRREWIVTSDLAQIHRALFFTVITGLSAFGATLVLYSAGWHSLRAGGSRP